MSESLTNDRAFARRWTGDLQAVARFQLILDKAHALQKMWAAAGTDVGSGKKAKVRGLLSAAGMAPSRSRRGWWNNVPGAAGGCRDTGYEDFVLD